MQLDNWIWVLSRSRILRSLWISASDTSSKAVSPSNANAVSPPLFHDKKKIFASKTPSQSLMQSLQINHHYHYPTTNPKSYSGEKHTLGSKWNDLALVDRQTAHLFIVKPPRGRPKSVRANNTAHNNNSSVWWGLNVWNDDRMIRTRHRQGTRGTSWE